jgi:hypothetical protein
LRAERLFAEFFSALLVGGVEFDDVFISYTIFDIKIDDYFSLMRDFDCFQDSVKFDKVFPVLLDKVVVLVDSFKKCWKIESFGVGRNFGKVFWSCWRRIWLTF